MKSRVYDAEDRDGFADDDEHVLTSTMTPTGSRTAAMLVRIDSEDSDGFQNQDGCPR